MKFVDNDGQELETAEKILGMFVKSIAVMTLPEDWLGSKAQNTPKAEISFRIPVAALSAIEVVLEVMSAEVDALELLHEVLLYLIVRGIMTVCDEITTGTKGGCDEKEAE